MTQLAFAELMIIWKVHSLPYAPKLKLLGLMFSLLQTFMLSSVQSQQRTYNFADVSVDLTKHTVSSTLQCPCLKRRIRVVVLVLHIVLHLP